MEDLFEFPDDDQCDLAKSDDQAFSLVKDDDTDATFSGLESIPLSLTQTTNYKGSNLLID